MDQEAYRKARKHVKRKREFYQHLGSYVIMGLFFFVLNLVTSPFDWWFYWPLLGWGIGIAFHYIDVFGIPGVGEMSPEWEERAIEEEIDKMKRRGEYDSSKSERLELKELEKRKSTWDDSELV